MAKAPAPAQETAVVPVDQRLVMYKARDGQEIQLSMKIVKDFLVTGKKDLVTVQEFTYFMGVCRARGLNPFARDCYLIKYSDDPAAIVTSIDFYRARARAQADCKGWEKGVICMDKETHALRYSKGLVLPNEILVGGWAKGQPSSWDFPMEIELNLSGYIKKTSTGAVTKFWSEPNQPTMIAKCAESQLLRTLWPDEFRGTITAEEAGVALETFQTIEIESLGEPEEVDTSAFDGMVKQSLVQASAAEVADTMTLLDKFLDDCATKNSRGGAVVTADDVKVKAGESSESYKAFWKVFQDWIAKRTKPAKTPEPKAAPKTPEVVNPVPVAGEDPWANEAPPSGPSPEEIKATLKELQGIAQKKNILSEVLKQFKVNSWDDFLALDPDMIPTLRNFVENAPQK